MPRDGFIRVSATGRVITAKPHPSHTSKPAVVKGQPSLIEAYKEENEFGYHR